MQEEPPTLPENEDAAPALPTAGEAAAWLATVKPAAVLALLKDPLYSYSVSRAFLGIRTDAKGYATPMVRTRLAQAAAKDAKLAEKFKELAETEPKAVVTIPPKAEAPPIPAATSTPKADPLLTLRAERDQRRRERDDARHLATAAQAERDIAQKAQRTAETERDEAARQAKKQAERIARLERQVAQLRQSETQLLRALNEDKVSPPPSQPARRGIATAAQATASASPWPAAVRHLLDKSKFDLALALAEDVLKSDGDDTDALEIAVRAEEGRREPRPALHYARRLLTQQIQRGDFTAAAETLLRVFRFAATPGQAEPDVRAFLSALPPTDGAAVEAARLMLTKLRGLDSAAHDWLAAYVDSRTRLSPILMPPPGALSPDDPLPLPLKPTVTARQLLDAVGRGSSPLVDAARTALSASDPETSARVWTALEQAAADDPARLFPLRRTPRGPAVVDGSNVAWFDQESLVQGRPRLKHLTAMRRTLWQRGFFPVVLYADANLPYAIDDKAALLTLRDRRELTLVDAGTVADEVLLRNAKHLNAPLVTNDRMEDWDPNGEVLKVRYAISLGGEAHLLTDI